MEAWKLTGWWRVIDLEGNIWCETSDEHEARDIASISGHLLQRQYTRVAQLWASV